MEKELSKSEIEFLDFISEEKENEYSYTMDRLFQDYDDNLFIP